MNILPYHANPSYKFSKERRNALLPYLTTNIVFVLEPLNAIDCSRCIFFDDPSKKYKLDDPEIIAWESRGWSTEIVRDVRAKYTKQFRAEYAKQLLNKSDHSAALQEA
jgi:hypothetical protein